MTTLADAAGSVLTVKSVNPALFALVKLASMNNQHLPNLSASFWEQSTQLRAIRDAAFSRMTSPDALLVCILCRIAVSVPHTVTLPNRTSINFIAALVGESGTGKSQAIKAARHLLPDIGTKIDGWNIGSGQGIASVYCTNDSDDIASTSTIRSALFCVDEGEQLLKLGKGTESITLGTIRSAWSGEGIGTTNASAERRRIVEPDSYRFAMTVGFQPKFAAELLTGVSAGDPQRFLFAGVTHPEQPDILPRFPNPLIANWNNSISGDEVIKVDPEITREINSTRIKRQRLEIVSDPLDSHKQLVQLKTAALLAILHSNGTGIEVSIKWWNAARLMVEISRGIRDRLVELAVLERRQHNNERTAEQIEAETIKEASREQRALESMVNTIANKCRTADRDFLHSELQQATASKHRLLVDFDIALDEALRRRVITHGSEVRRYQSARNLGT